VTGLIVQFLQVLIPITQGAWQT